MTDRNRWEFVPAPWRFTETPYNSTIPTHRALSKGPPVFPQSISLRVLLRAQKSRDSLHDA